MKSKDWTEDKELDCVSPDPYVLESDSANQISRRCKYSAYYLINGDIDYGHRCHKGYSG